MHTQISPQNRDHMRKYLLFEDGSDGSTVKSHRKNGDQKCRLTVPLTRVADLEKIL